MIMTLLRENLERNGLTMSRSSNAALAAAPGTITLHSGGGAADGSITQPSLPGAGAV